MKKLLSIVICVLVGVTSVIAQSTQKGKITINASVTTGQEHCGTVQVATKTATNYATLGGWDFDKVSWTYGPTGVTSSQSGYAQYEKPALIGHTTGIQFQLNADAQPGYYLNQWTNVPYYKESYIGGNWKNDGTFSDNPYEGETKYKESGEDVYNITASFAPLTVNSVTATDITNGSYDANSKTLTFNTSGLNATASATITFAVHEKTPEGMDDYDWEQYSNIGVDGFEVEPIGYNETDKTVTFNVTFQDININGSYAPITITLTSKAAQNESFTNSSQTITIIANSDLTPTYAMPASYEFKGDEAELEYKVPVNATVGSQSALYATNKNNVASAVTGEWEAEVVNEQAGDDNSAFNIVGLANGNFVVNFKPTEAKTYAATLKTRVTYVDSKGQTIYSDYVTTRLSGTGIKTERSLITFNPAEWDFGEQPTGYTGNKQFSVTLENAANVTYSFGENLAEGFPFTYDASAEGFVTVIADAIAPGTYNATLTATGDNTIEGEEGNKTTATLPVSIKVGLQSPLLQAGSNQTDLYYLTWNVVPYATSHAIYEVNGETKTDITSQVTWVTTEGNQLVVSIPSDGTAKSYIVNSSGEYNEETYEAWSNVVTANMTKKLYFHVGPSVYVSGHEEMGGEVYVDDGTAGTVANVTGWTSKIEDANTYAQNTTDFSYTYYAKVSDDTKYAFKGWATTLHGEPAYTDNPLTITETMSDENTSVDVRFLTTPYYAVFESFYYKCPAVSVATPSRGSGKVFVSLTGASVDDCTQEDITASTEVRQVPAAKENHGYRVYYYAKANDGANFVGWSTTADGLNIISTADTYNTMYYSTNKSKDLPHVAAPLYAVFRSDIDVRQQDRMIVYVDDEGNGNINDAKVLVNFQKGTKLKATLDGGDASLFILSNRSGSKSGNSVTFDATQGLVELVVAYTGDLANAVGKEAKITLTATYFDNHTVDRPISIIVEEAPVITFLPTDGKGEYTIKMTNGSGVNYKMTSANTEYIKVPVTHESMSNIEMNLTQDAINDGYYFFAWQMIDGDEKRYLSYEQLCNYQFTKSVKVRPEFIHNSIATYRIANDPSSTPYYDFAAAMKDAEKLYKANGSYQFVILNDTRLSDDGKKTTINVKTAVLPKGKYTIPNGVRLVIPRKGSSDFKSNLTTDDYFQGGPNQKEHIRWIVEEGTTIDVNGNAIICVLAKVACAGAGKPNGTAMDYGHIELRENCCITFNNSAKCYAYGYITGPSSSSVVMKKGTEVKELMQIQDWPGGAKMAQYYLGGTQRVFPISQFYVQNVEAPLVLERGSKETLHAAILVSGITSFDFDFIGANSGFFRIGEGSFTKAYDPAIDRMQFTTSPDATTGTGNFTLGNIAFSVNLGVTANIDSKNYVLPLIHSFDFIFGSGTNTTILYDAALLPSATMHVEKDATVNVASTSNVYVYGKEYATINGVGYYGDASTLIPVYGRLAGMFKRTVEMLEDAKVVVDGQIVLDGKLYTTSGTVDPKYANITSNGGGKVVYNQIGSSTGNTYQLADQSATAIPVVPARLKNEDTSVGQYTTPAKGNTYTYVDKKWQVTSETCDPIIPDKISYIPTFTTSDYSTSAYVGGNVSVGSITIATNNDDIDWSKVTWGEPVIEGDNADQFKFAFDDKGPQGKVTFKPESDGIKTATLRITATYKPTIQMGSKSVTVTYTYSQDIHLTGNAIYLAANTLAFADLTNLYKGMTTPANLFKTDSKNNGEGITITQSVNILNVQGRGEGTTILPTNIGTVTITAKQGDDLTKNIAGTTITKTITITEPVVWNWGDLYFGTVNENPVTILNGATSWTLEEKEDESNIINLQGTSPNYKATIVDQIAGKYHATFTYTDNKGIEEVFTSDIYANPRHLRVDVNNDTVFRAVTLSANNQVEYHQDSKSVQFTSTSNTISQWKMTFIGVPDKVYFTPIGGNTWQIEESDNGINWTTSMPWKYLTPNIAFEMSLRPNTRYVRVSYGAGDSYTGRLHDFYITELADVKADVDKLYLPVEGNATDGYVSVTKDIALTYANVGQLSVTTSNSADFRLKLTDSAAEPAEAFNLPATTEENPFAIANIEVISNAKTEQLAYLYVYQGKNLLLQIPIQTYFFPQELPIKLATDKPDGGDRFYYVTTHMHNVEWDGTNGVRTITLDNAVSDAAPYLTFAFDGNPTYIGFDYTPSSHNNTTWEIEEFVDGEWKTVPYKTYSEEDILGEVAGVHQLKRHVSPNADKLRVIYQSDYAEKIQMTNLVIVGNASAVVDPTKLELDYDVAKQVTLTAINLPGVKATTSSDNFTIAHQNDAANYLREVTLSSSNYDILNGSKMGDISFNVKWTGNQMVEYGTLTYTYYNAADNTDPKNGEVLATVELVGVKNTLTNGILNIKTGVADGYTLKGIMDDEGKGTFDKKGAELRPIDIFAAFSTSDVPLFDYVVVYGETSTNDGNKTITTPTSTAGSNAKTPCYVYKSNGTNYVLEKHVENANSKDKVWPDAVTIPNGKNKVSMYITGFCPYASTGYTKDQEGVWYFTAKSGESIDIYLEDCYIYSRAKTIDGHTFADRSDGQSFVDAYVRGTGAVLVFMCETKKDNNPTAMNVTIHTLDNNLLKSNYGCFLQSVAGRAFQASSPVQIRIKDDTYYGKVTPTNLNFTDEWGASKNSNTVDGSGNAVRTNGFISLQKQVNNAPSIDMGDPNTTVNFNGGQVELQNAQIVSHNYKSSLAICPRSGKFAEFRLAYGMGTDDVGGTVNFKDGTTTVLPMWVSPDYFESYLCDKDEHGNFITNAKGEYLTTCLRTPTKTFVTGGSHCMMRACKDPSSQGGAPKDKAGNDGKLLGLYKFPKNPDSEQKGGWSVNGTNGLVTPTTGNVPDGYKVESVTPNNNETTTDDSDDYLNFWFDPDFEPAAQPEIDKTISYWLTCMTEIGAEYAAKTLSVGGETFVEFTDDGIQSQVVKNLLYCKIDENIHGVIERDDFMAPVKNPAPEGEGYIPIKPNLVGEFTEHYITNEESYQVENKVYYITTATADIWNAFTAPFDVANIYVMETYSEDELDRMSWDKKYPGGIKSREDILTIQAEQNAYFAGFCAVTIALQQNKNFERMYDEYMDWARLQDIQLGLCDENTTLSQYKNLNLRGMRKLIPYNGSNWATADFYLNENTDDWEIKETDGDFETQWAIPDASDGKLLEQGKTYSMLLPYCTGCVEKDEGGNPIPRTYWDYWTGKFLIFESTEGPHTISGTNDYWDMITTVENDGIGENTAKILGNTTFDLINMSSDYDVLAYTADIAHSTFLTEDAPNVEPTVSFMLANIPTPQGISVMSVSRDGMITYSGKPGDGTTTGTNTPTVGGGNDLFITAINGGINIAVAAPQMVYVVNATGHVLYNGYVTDNVNVSLPISGIYVVKGENEVQKIFF